MYSKIIKPLLFSLPAESAHDLSLELSHLAPWMGSLLGKSNPSELKTKVGTLDWSAPWGLAAGLDKNAHAIPFFSKLGFGALECGTITQTPQLGNAKPRMFRYPTELSLRNSMGFPSLGLEKVSPGFLSKTSEVPVGANIGKNKESSPRESIQELKNIYESLKERADYFVINVSSPNTPGLRHLQDRSYLSELFSALKNPQKDLYLKIAPDLDQGQLAELYQVARDFNLTGLIATNTTMMPERGVGGVSGELLKTKSFEIYSKLLELNGDENFEIIAVGGIGQWNDVLALWKQGGKAFQVYTSFIYQGPKLLQNFQDQSLAFLKEKQVSSLEEFFKLKRSERMRFFSPDNLALK